MADINVERKGPSIWPWIIGLLVLALLIWAIAEMVDTDEPQVAEVEEVEPTGAPAAVPAPTMQPEAAEPVELQTLMPLGEDDAGRTITARGTVVGQPIPEGYWLLTDQDAVLFVLTQQQVTSGATVEVTGRLAPSAYNQTQEWRRQANLQPANGWNVHEDLFIAPAGAAQQGATGAGQPGDTMGAGATHGTAPTTQPGATQQTP